MILDIPTLHGDERDSLDKESPVRFYQYTAATENYFLL